MKINSHLKGYAVEFSFYIINHKITSINLQFVPTGFQSCILIRLKQTPLYFVTSMPSNHNYCSTLILPQQNLLFNFTDPLTISTKLSGSNIIS